MRKALIVDDHPFIRRIVRLVLEKANFQVAAETDNGATALDLARSHIPHLIILDLSMPKLDGLEVLKRLHILGLPIKVLVLTSKGSAFLQTAVSVQVPSGLWKNRRCRCVNARHPSCDEWQHLFKRYQRQCCHGGKRQPKRSTIDQDTVRPGTENAAIFSIRFIQQENIRNHVIKRKDRQHI